MGSKHSSQRRNKGQVNVLVKAGAEKKLGYHLLPGAHTLGQHLSKGRRQYQREVVDMRWQRRCIQAAADEEEKDL